MTLETVKEAVQSLTAEEQRQLRVWMDAQLTPPAPISEEEFEQKLLEAGIISRTPPPITDFTPYQNRKLVEVQGKPISETIIEDRGSY